MKIVVVVSDFPKVTETFALANVLHYLSKGHDARIFHLKPFRINEIIHPGSEPVVDTAFTFPWLRGASAAAMVDAVLTHPIRLARCFGKILWAFRAEPKRLLASLAILPKAVALGRYATQQGIQHIHAEFASHPATAAWIASEVYGVPFSFSAHMHDIFVSQSLLAEKSRKARFVRTISGYNQRFLSRIHGFSSDKIALIRCGVDPSRFPDAAQAVPELGDRLDILFVGALLPRKGVNVLLDALAVVQLDVQWHLTILGGGPRFDELRHMAEAFPAGQITFFGPATMNEVKSAMQAAHLVVVPSIVGEQGRSEGIPVVLMEALAASRPVIASRLSGIPELVEDNVTGYLAEPGDAIELAAIIRTVTNDYQHALELGRKGRQRILVEYNIKTNAAELLDMIERTSEA